MLLATVVFLCNRTQEFILHVTKCLPIVKGLSPLSILIPLTLAITMRSTTLNSIYRQYDSTSMSLQVGCIKYIF